MTSGVRLGFIGLGTMGGPMAAHLARAGFPLAVYNRSPARAQAWLQQAQFQQQVLLVDSPTAVAQQADLVLLCVGDDADVREVCLGPNGVFAGLAAGGLVVDHSTTSAGLARALYQQAARQNLAWLDAPVSGGEQGAQRGQLSIMVGGDADALARAEPVLATYAKAIRHMGGPGAGQLTKMVNQICVAGVLQGLAEGLGFAVRAGLDPAQVIAAVAQGAAQSWQLEQRGPSMTQGRFDFGFAVDWMRKDLGIALAAAREQGSSLPLTALVDQLYAEVQAMGGGRWDTSSLILRLLPELRPGMDAGGGG